MKLLKIIGIIILLAASEFLIFCIGGIVIEKGDMKVTPYIMAVILVGYGFWIYAVYQDDGRGGKNGGRHRRSTKRRRFSLGSQNPNVLRFLPPKNTLTR